MTGIDGARRADFIYPAARGYLSPRSGQCFIISASLSLITTVALTILIALSFSGTMPGSSAVIGGEFALLGLVLLSSTLLCFVKSRPSFLKGWADVSPETKCQKLKDKFDSACETFGKDPSKANAKRLSSTGFAYQRQLNNMGQRKEKGELPTVDLRYLRAESARVRQELTLLTLTLKQKID